jgi:hypothetical protein
MSDPKHAGGGDTRPTPGYETRDLTPRAIATFLVVLAVTIVGVLVVSMWIYDYSASRLAQTEAPPSPLAKPAAPPEPRLQVAAPKDMQEFRAAEDAALKSYGWVDRAAGAVRIPIDRAMQLLAERGLPAAGGRSQAAKAKGK